MKFSKTLLAAVVMTAAPLALAESSVTLYGSIDGAVAVQKEKGRTATVQLMDGVAGGSVWGLEGTEELGNGYSVGFNLENSYTMDDGAEGESGLAWAKQASLNVSGGFGTLAFGRIGGLASYEGTYSIWDASPFGTDYLQIGLGNAFVTGQINNNTVHYSSPEFSGLQLHLQYSNGTEADTQKWSRNAHYFGIGATYEIGGLNLAGIVERFDNKGEDDMKPTMVYSLSAAYDFEAVKVYFGYQYASHFHGFDQSEDWVFAGKGLNQNAFTLGAEVPAAGGTFKAAVNYGFGKIKSMDKVTLEDADAAPDRDKFDRLGVGAAYEYPLSKRTMVYGWGAWQKGGKALKTAEVRGDFENWSLGVGMRHEF